MTELRTYIPKKQNVTGVVEEVKDLADGTGRISSDVRKDDGTLLARVLRTRAEAQAVADQLDAILHPVIPEPEPAPEPAPVPAPTPVPAPDPAGWKLVKEWNFDVGSSLTGLNLYNGFQTSGNNVGGVYKLSNLRLADGELRIVGDGINGGGLNVNLYRTYGRWEVRARMDYGSGAGPCLVLWPQSDRWPQDGEIDFMESAYGSHMEVAVTTHWGVWPDHQYDQKKLAIDAKLWHVYAVEWESGVIRYYIDGVLVHTKSGNPGWDIPNKPMSLALQVDGPNGWIPKRDAASPAEMTFHVDYARVYSR